MAKDEVPIPTKSADQQQTQKVPPEGLANDWNRFVNWVNENGPIAIDYIKSGMRNVGQTVAISKAEFQKGSALGENYDADGMSDKIASDLKKKGQNGYVADAQSMVGEVSAGLGMWVNVGKKLFAEGQAEGEKIEADNTKKETAQIAASSKPATEIAAKQKTTHNNAHGTHHSKPNPSR